MWEEVDLGVRVEGVHEVWVIWDRPQEQAKVIWAEGVHWKGGYSGRGGGGRRVRERVKKSVCGGGGE